MRALYNRLKTINKTASAISEDFSEVLKHSQLKSKLKLKTEIVDILKILNNLNVQIDANLPEIEKQESLQINLKQRMQAYNEIISELPENCKIYPEAKVCATMLYKWMSVRFYSDKKLKTGYKISRFPEWIENFVIAYGLNLYKNTLQEFLTSFDCWCDAVISGNNKFIVPKQIYNFSTGLCVNDISITSLVIWDILYDSGLKELPNVNASALLNRFASFDLDNNDTDLYVHYKYNENILETAKIHKNGR